MGIISIGTSVISCITGTWCRNLALELGQSVYDYTPKISFVPPEAPQSHEPPSLPFAVSHNFLVVTTSAACASGLYTMIKLLAQRTLNLESRSILNLTVQASAVACSTASAYYIAECAGYEQISDYPQSPGHWISLAAAGIGSTLTAYYFHSLIERQPQETKQKTLVDRIWDQ